MVYHWRGGRLTSLCFAFILFCICLTFESVDAVDKAKFRTCQQSSFCRRYRKLVNYAREKHTPLYVVDPSTVNAGSGQVSFELENTVDKSHLKASIKIYRGGVIKYDIDEINPLHERYRIPEGDVTQDVHLELDMNATFANVETGSLEVESRFETNDGNYPLLIKLSYSPFDIEVHADGSLKQLINGDSLLNFERYRSKTSLSKMPPGPLQEAEDARLAKEGGAAALASGDALVYDATCLDGEELWEDSFGGHTDSKPKGPAAVGIDVAFNNAPYIFGLAEHATSLNLPTYDEPYRLYNLDVFEYILDSPMALYGAVPLVTALHLPDEKATEPSTAQTSGFLWVNPSETWVGLDRVRLNPNESPEREATLTWWSSESGVISAFTLLGPTPTSVLAQYHMITGLPAMPPLFALGKHQCRWNYNSQDDVKAVDEGFDEHDIPYDVIWLDIEHTDGKKYMTWNQNHFSQPKEMIDNVASKYRKMVTIVDPHIKKDDHYPIFTECRDQDLFTKKASGEQYEGWCWPGASFYPDFTNSKVRDYFGGRYALDKYVGSTKDLFIWNDMNEPSVFNGPEVSMPRDNLHWNNAEHRDIHNLYGMYYARSTYEGLLKRDPNQRPFVLSRSFFAGGHRYGAIWTGDNMAQWDHLQASVPMLLSHALCGISFIGADVAGFFGNPDTELFVRWHQLGIWYPFYRAHAHLDAKRREPWLFKEDVMNKVRSAVTDRYRFIPFWYTIFAEHALLGDAVIRPMWYEFTSDPNTYTLEDQFMVGDTFLVKPVSAPLASKPTLAVYLPKGPSHWYLLSTGMAHAPGSWNVNLVADNIPVFVKGGTIVLTKERRRRSTGAMVNDPYTMHIYAAKKAEGEGIAASGRIYVDDYNSFNYEKKKEFLYQAFDFVDGVLSSDAFEIIMKKFYTPGEYVPPHADIEKISIYGLAEVPSGVWFKKNLLLPNDPPIALEFSATHAQDPRGAGKVLLRVDIKRPPICLGVHNWRIVLATTKGGQEGQAVTQ